MKTIVETTVKWCPGHTTPAKDGSRDFEVSVEVLAYTNLGFYCKARYDYRNKEWYITDGEDMDCGGLVWEDGEHVVCWMYLPKPPKEVLKRKKLNLTHKPENE